ncbi:MULTISPECIES: glucose 1-dehydrogenase [Heyndrickxia]|jgi:3alpha(or 20beta)-hydroxysteroid dehydrogenase|uniref:3-alpha-hydroxysteroid dehydrogenase n=1 Tax=Heyndrickxia oleronia TaxID=38875 RepID=A0A8E2I9D9_9BACI|nr:glucose 1-dehydrogenase [Heyndrickxia oleronia]NYV66375.1 glucose 1-dehydrogenase [Bacillus sp. Gen3]OJH18424.1 3-alpha-hydroxysteroid dehydrogenase [Bacillus obstructivus]MBU5211428.1 glucose 1-dehydrogenase [Heyndrickxia oleronia]MCI1590227.1 glucose 1-dehydrogenase [Heyndrickxia oleronia]MCI1614009.1 glucose 1-dehydrogenase [Heyndrickxia oleronia]
MTRLEGKVAIITGAAQGMGASHARRFVAEGAKVVITDLNEEKGTALASELGENVLFVKQNVTSAEDWAAVVAKAEEKFGPVNVLVNNAGITMAKSILETTEEEYRRIVDINQVSVFLGMKNVIPSMQKVGGGSIVNISSINGIVGGAVGYTDTKFAVRGMTKAAAMECSHYGIRVNSVHPGVIATPMVVQEDTKAAVEEFAKHIPLKRVAQPEEVTNLVLYLASDESSYSTGAEFIVDGGITAM